MKAKNVSLWGKILIAVLLLAMFVLKSIGIFNVSTGDIILVSFAIYGILSGTIDINLMIDKFTGEKEENKEK